MSHKDMWIEEYERLREKFIEEGVAEAVAERRAELMASESLMDRYADWADNERRRARGG